MYCVADLVIPVEDCTGQLSATPGRARAKTQESKLIQLLTTTLAPQTWTAQGGRGTVEYFPLTYALVITQTADIHEQIADLLAGLRRLQGIRVAIEVRFISAPADVCERMAQDLGIDARDLNPQPPAGCAGKQPAKVAFLDDKHLRNLLEAVQGDVHTNVMQAPRLTACNGQQLGVSCTDVQHFVTGMAVRWDGERVRYEPKTQDIPLGVRLSVQPVVAGDRRWVRLHFCGELTSLESSVVPLCPVVAMPAPAAECGPAGRPAVSTPSIQMPAVCRLSVDRTLTIADGGTALLIGWRRLSEGRKEYGPPVLSKVPYVERVFKNVSYSREAESVLLAVTPRILIEQEEERQAGVRPAARAKEASDQGGTEEQGLNVGTCPRRTEPANAQVAELLRRYHRACAEGRAREATSLAVQALALDPACFSRSVKKGGAKDTCDR
jgi:general secretion pathway protein D